MTGYNARSRRLVSPRASLEVSMSRARVVAVLCLSLVWGTVYSVRADVKTEQKTRVQFGGVLGGIVNFFGGKSAREGVTSTVAVKGDRKVTTSNDTGRIVDLTEEKIYDLDLKRKSYKVTTFAEYRRQLEEARKKAEEEARKAESRESKEKTAPPEKDPNAKEMQVDFDVKETGQTKTLAGFETREVVLTITMHEKGKPIETSGGILLTSDMWNAASVAGLKEIQEFDLRFYQKIAGPMVVSGASPEEMGRMIAAYPMMKEGLAKLAEEGQKLKGTPILTVMTFDAVKSAEQVEQEAKQGDSDKGSSDKSGDPVSGLLGGLAKRAAARRAKSNDSGGDQQQSKNRTTIMTSTTEYLKIAPDVTAADLAVPAGFKENK
jgi:hypothetical protein